MCVDHTEPWLGSLAPHNRCKQARHLGTVCWQRKCKRSPRTTQSSGPVVILHQHLGISSAARTQEVAWGFLRFLTMLDRTAVPTVGATVTSTE